MNRKTIQFLAMLVFLLGTPFLVKAACDGMCIEYDDSCSSGYLLNAGSGACNTPTNEPGKCCTPITTCSGMCVEADDSCSAGYTLGSGACKTPGNEVGKCCKPTTNSGCSGGMCVESDDSCSAGYLQNSEACTKNGEAGKCCKPTTNSGCSDGMCVESDDSCSSGYSQSSEACTKNGEAGKCCKQASTCASPASCISKDEYSQGCPSGYSGTSGSCSDSGDSCCQPNSTLPPGDDGGTNTGGTPCAGGMVEFGICIPNVGLPAPSGGVTGIVSNLLSWLLGIFGIVAIISFAVSGIMYFISAGDDEMMGKAKKAMTYSIIGVVVALSGFVIIQAIDSALSGTNPFF